jgi:hydrogenase expression/formation protein HypC
MAGFHWGRLWLRMSFCDGEIDRRRSTTEEVDMCLAIPGRVVETYDQRGLHMAKVQFGGIVREACLEYVPETVVGDYVLVHVGFAISRVDEAEAERTYQALQDLDQLTELNSPVVEEIDLDSGPDSGKEPR